MKSSGPTRRFPPPWPVEMTGHGYVVKDANGVTLAQIYCRDDLHSARWGNYLENLTSDEARRIAKAIARIPEFLHAELPEFKRSENPHWSKSHPYHVALADSYVQENYDAIAACCVYNGVPFERTGGVIEGDGLRWCVYKFARQIAAIRFWDKFGGKWMYREWFIYPERPHGLPAMRSLKHRGAL